MTEETGQTATSTEETVSTETITAPMVNADGELREGWRDSLPEDIRNDKVFDRVSNFEGIMKSLSSAERKFGKDKVAVPNESSSETEWDAFYVASGRPTTVADYNLTRPEEVPEEYYNQELATSAQELFHSIGLSQKQADALFAFNNNNVVAQLTKIAQDEELSAKELKDGLIRDWGNAFEQRKHLGNVAIEQGVDGDAEFKTRLVEKYGNDPDFIRFASNVGNKFVEQGAVDSSKLVPTTGDLQSRIDEEMHKPAYGIDYTKHGFSKADHKRQVDLVYSLRQELIKSTKTG